MMRRTRPWPDEILYLRVKTEKQGQGLAELRGTIFETSAAESVSDEINFLSRARKKFPDILARVACGKTIIRLPSIAAAAVLRGTINYFISRCGIANALIALLSFLLAASPPFSFPLDESMDLVLPA